MPTRDTSPTPDPFTRTACGGRLARTRLAHHGTPAQLATAAGVSRVTVTRLESGWVPRPRPRTVQRLADARGVAVTWLSTGVGEAEDRP